MPRQLALTLFSFLILAGIAACGGSDVATTETTTPAETAVISASPTSTPTAVPPPTPTPTTTPASSPVLTPAPAQSSAATPLPTETEAQGESQSTIPEETESPSPSPTAMTREEVISNACAPDYYAYVSPFGEVLGIVWPPARGEWRFENYIRWSPDGSRILFDVSELIFDGPVDLYGVAADGSQLNKIVSPEDRSPPWSEPSSMIYFDVSPDGSRIAFALCVFDRDSKADEADVESPYNYEIAVANIDGTDASRLTHTPGSENFPVWSPDGTSIAYYSSNDAWGRIGGLKIHTLATGDIREIDLPMGDWVGSHPPAWSPDGQRLAFVGYEWLERQSRTSVWTVEVDGSNLTRIAFAASGPAWSPDGKRIAMAVPRGPNKASLYTFAADGSDPTFVSLDLPEPWDEPVEPWLGNLSWSPDGSAILLEGFAHAVNVDGSGVLFDGFASVMMHIEGSDLVAHSGKPPEAFTRVFNDFPEFTQTFAAWSPDGSEIAILTERLGDRGLRRVQVYIMDRDGSNPRVLVEGVESDNGLELRLAQ